jgi:Reverse transcriptase (RNA-dependent DNA polymerase)
MVFRNFEFSYTNAKKKPVFVPNDKSRKIGAEIKHHIEDACTFPGYYHLADGGHVAALHAHRDNVLFARVDIKNFFYSISRNRVARLLHEVGMPRAGWYAKWSSVPNPYGEPRYALPYGFVQSPIVATLALQRSAVGQLLEALPDEITSTVYLDDIAISSKDEFALKQAFGELVAALDAANFPINDKKTAGPGKQILLFNCDLTSGSSVVTADRITEFYSAHRTEASASGFERYRESIKSGNSS